MMKLKKKFFSIGIALSIILLYIKISNCYILNINIDNKDDLFFFLYKNEHLLASSYYNFKPSYFFSFEEGEININLTVDFKESKYVKKKVKTQEVLAKANKNAISLFNHLNINKYFQQIQFINVLKKNDELKLTNELNKNKIYKDDVISNVNETINENVNENVNDVNISQKSDNLYLVLITANQWINYIKLKNKLEPSLKNKDNYIFTSHFNCVKRYPLNKGEIKKKIQIKQKNRYMLFLINNNKLKLNIKGYIFYYDVKTKHLSNDFIFIPNVLLFTATTLCIILFVMIYTYTKTRIKFDIFMIFNIFFFLLYTIFNYENIQFIKYNGYVYIYYWILANIFKKIQKIIAFVIYLQLSLGDMYIRNNLSRVEIQFTICFSVVSFYTGVFELILGNFQAPRYIIQAFAYLFIFIAINFTSTFLSARLIEENLSFHVAELYRKHDIYKKYRLLFFAVILKPIILVIYKVLCLTPSNIDLYSSHEYFYFFFDLFFDITIYVSLFILFRPPKPIKFLKHILNSEELHIN